MTAAKSQSASLMHCACDIRRNTSRWSNRAIQAQRPASLSVSHSKMVFEAYNAPAVAAQSARLLADCLRTYVGLVPRWRAEYFERMGGPPQRSIIIAAQNVADALEEVRARMSPACSRVEVTKLDPDTVLRVV
jgi:hypothetical protein